MKAGAESVGGDRVPNWWGALAEGSNGGSGGARQDLRRASDCGTAVKVRMIIAPQLSATDLGEACSTWAAW